MSPDTNPATKRTADLYADPLVYDILHAPDTASEVRALERLAKRYLGDDESITWLEPACGTARYLRALAKRGHRAVGFDLSAVMIAFANAQVRREGVARRVELFAADMRSFDRGRELPRVDAAFNLINTIRHLGSDAAMIAHLRAVARVVRPGGVYIVGLSLCSYGNEQETEDVWAGRRAGVSVTQVVQYLPAPGPVGRRRLERVISHLTVRSNRSTRHVDSSYTLRGYDLAQWRNVLQRARLRIIGVTDNNGKPAIPREPGYFLFVLGR